VVVGIVGLLALLFFGSTAFTVVESATAIIFPDGPAGTCRIK